MYKCPFCNGNDCVETKIVPRGCKKYIGNDKEIQIMNDKYLHEIKCNTCKMTFSIDKDLYTYRD